jgi:hypothetical protein
MLWDIRALKAVPGQVRKRKLASKEREGAVGGGEENTTLVHFFSKL